MYKEKQKIIYFAIFTRLTVHILQFLSNKLLPDHDADAFISPKSQIENSTADVIIEELFGGYVRWDAQYFVHISKYGYTYESTIAFLPLLPFITSFLSELITIWFPVLNIHSSTLLTFLIFNSILFVKTALVLYELTFKLINRKIAYYSAIIFCINPATIFFVAPYTECLFSYLTFSFLNCCVNLFDSRTKDIRFGSYCKAVIFLCLSLATRSNGLLNVAFIGYFFVQNLFTVKDGIEGVAKKFFLLFIALFLSVFIFTFIQGYFYYKFCKDFVYYMDDFLKAYAVKNNYVLPGSVSLYKQTWCFNKLPLAYSYVQDHYWEVGFLRYFEFKQIPNFLLAAPILYILLTNAAKFFQQHRNYCLNLGIFNFKTKFKQIGPKRVKINKNFNENIFVFVVHIAFLSLFCFFCIHVQVSTRMLCSSSPVFYWFCAYQFDNEYANVNAKMPAESVKNLRSKIKVFIFDENLKRNQLFLKYYFLSYFIVGIIMFCNFLPWT